MKKTARYVKNNFKLILRQINGYLVRTFIMQVNMKKIWYLVYAIWNTARKINVNFYNRSNYDSKILWS